MYIIYLDYAAVSSHQRTGTLFSKYCLAEIVKLFCFWWEEGQNVQLLFITRSATTLSIDKRWDGSKLWCCLQQIWPYDLSIVNKMETGWCRQHFSNLLLTSFDELVWIVVKVSTEVALSIHSTVETRGYLMNAAFLLFQTNLPFLPWPEEQNYSIFLILMNFSNSTCLHVQQIKWVTNMWCTFSTLIVLAIIWTGW